MEKLNVKEMDFLAKCLCRFSNISNTNAVSKEKCVIRMNDKPRLAEIYYQFQSFSKLSELLEEVNLSKYSLSICWHSSTKFLCCLTILVNLVSGKGVVKMAKRWPKTNASSSVGLKAKSYVRICKIVLSTYFSLKK